MNVPGEALLEGGHNLQGLAGVRFGFLEHRGGEGNFDSCRETLGVFHVGCCRAPS